MATITKDGFKKALEERRIVIIGAKWSPKNYWVGFRVFEIRNNELLELRGLGNLWNDKKGCYYSTWETSRPVEVILSIGSFLGLKFHEIKQNQIEIIGAN